MALAWGEIRSEVAAFSSSFDPSVLSPADAERLVRDAAAVENMAAAVKARAAARAADGGGWRRDGARSPEHALARQTGSSVSRARDALETARKLDELPALDAAVRAGELSPEQAAPIAEAASANPGAEARLVDKARRAGLGELRDECARTKAAALPDDAARHEAIRRGRFLRRRRCADGAGEILYRSTVDEVAEVFSVVQGFANRAFDEARRAGVREREEAYLADGLLAACRAASGAGAVADDDAVVGPTGARMAAGGRGVDGAGTAGKAAYAAADTGGDRSADGGAEIAGGGVAGGAPDDGSGGVQERAGKRRVRKPTATKVVVRIDWDALIRGWPVEGEVCEIAGLGPVAVSAVRAMIERGDVFLAGVVTKGEDVARVFHLGRRPTARQATALDWLSPTCVTEGCNNTWRLETDHREDWARTRVTLLRWLERHCAHCHDLKTRHGWALIDGRGKRPLVPPEDLRHPGAAGARAQPRAG